MVSVLKVPVTVKITLKLSCVNVLHFVICQVFRFIYADFFY
jgi:hypothetical protein